MRRVIIAVGAVLLLAGVIGLLAPVSVQHDNGGTVSCGNGIATDLSAARSANDRSGPDIPILKDIIPHTDYVAQCQSSVSSRRMWTVPLVAIGVVGIASALLVRRTEGATTSA